MKNITIEEKFYQELKESIDTNLIFADIEILEYQQEGNLEYLKIELPFTTTGNILTYCYNKETDELSLIDAVIYVMSNESDKEPYIDNTTIMKLYNYCRNIASKEYTTYNPKISKIFDIIAKGFQLNNETLLLYQFTNEDIQKLIDSSILIPTESNEYNISLTKELYHYGIKLLLTDRKISSSRCFKKCYESEPGNRDYCLQIMLLFLTKRNYKDVLVLFSHIETITREDYKNDNILYLYLLKMLTNVGEEYQKRVESFDSNELLAQIDKKNISKEDYIIRRKIFIYKLKYALKLLNNKLSSTSKYSVKDELLRELLRQTIDKEEIFKSKLTSAIEEERYQDLKVLLEEKLKNRYLNSSEMYIYLITKSLIEISETRTIPIPTIAHTTYLYDAIKGNNFSLAQNLNREFILKKHMDLQNDLVNMILNKINALILEIKLDIEIENTNVETSPEDIDSKYLLSNVRKQQEYEKSIESQTTQTEEPTIEEEQQLSFAEEIAYYIKSENISIETAKKQLGIIPSQVLLIKLIYARDYFIEGKDELGNELLREVERSKDKNKEVKALLGNITRNKNTYKEMAKKRARRIIEENKKIRSDIK